MKSETRKAYIKRKDGSKKWFEIPRETAEKVLRLQKMFAEESPIKEIKKEWHVNVILFFWRANLNDNWILSKEAVNIICNRL